ncbi:MAG: hypothetical protein KF705_08290 [Phycisphaeraceae bacterium]|nr:hypothetical protein [Phycisphaeraceae bacterium]
MSMRPTPDPHPRHDPRDEYTLLCERCGYVLEGLAQDGNCPECGTPIAESLPGNTRTGTDWQRSPAPHSFLTTLWRTLAQPRRTFDRLRIDARSTGSLEAWTTLLAAALFVAPSFVYYALRVLFGPNPAQRSILQDAALGVAGLIGGTLIVALILSILTGIERTGIRAYGRVHRRRITYAIANSVCAHACVGWLTAAVLFSIALLVARSVGSFWWLVLPTLALFLGLLHFEILVWLGVKRCRYANRERPQTSPPLSRPVHPSR